MAAGVILAAATGVTGGPTDRLPLRHREHLAAIRAPVVHEGSTLASWIVLTQLLMGGALIGVAGMGSRRRRSRRWTAPAPTADALRRAQMIVQRHGHDSLAPFVASPDKALEFAGGGVGGYRLIKETAVVSGDPVGPSGAAVAVVARLRARARAAGARIVIYGSSAEHVEAYRALGLRALCVGEEAVVDPARFTLEGRPVRKLRQSVHRVRRRGWQIEALLGREVTPALEAEIQAVEAAWRAEHPRILGFAMSHGTADPGVRPADVYLLARSPEGELRGVMRFLAHCGGLSLDTMRRVGQTPNGLNEALVCAALAHAAANGVAQVSLNYAGLAHLIRSPAPAGPVARLVRRWTLGVLSRRFQMGRLVMFNEKFSPTWRPRYLIYESRRSLPGSILRVLQAEGYLPAGPALRARFVQLAATAAGSMWRIAVTGAPVKVAVRGLALTAALAVLGLGGYGAYSYANEYDLHRGFATLEQLPRAGTGRLENVRFYSPALHRPADYLIYLPPGYGSGKRYPVYYLLHGMPGQPKVFVDIANMDVRLDNQMSLGAVRPMILVYPDGRIGGSVFSDSEWANTPAGAFESYVMEVVHQVDHHYRTLPDRRDRVIGGFSAGAFGAVNIALHHLGTFANIQSWSGYFAETRSGVFAHASRAMLRDNSPRAYVRGLAGQIAHHPVRADLFVGRDDSDASQQAPMVRALRAAGAQVHAAVYPGGHDWALWYAHLNQMLQGASHEVSVPLHARTGRRTNAAAPRTLTPVAVHATASHGPALRRPASIWRLLAALGLALVSAALINLGFLLQHRGRARLGPGRRLAAAFTSRLWLSGQAVGWA